MTDLVEAERAGRLALDELRALVVNIVGGAIGTSRASIENTVLPMLQHPDHIDRTAPCRAGYPSS